jgi:2-dehydro-3-deoxyphosphooctonate aldolase (KDO 8-P synthase)
MKNTMKNTMLPTVQPVQINNDFVIGDNKTLTLIAGPCVIESEKHICEMAEGLIKITEDLKINFIFKASYDKANRSSENAYRGPGIKEGLRILAKVKRDYNVPIISDVHSVEEARIAGEVLDVIQIPSLLSRQTDLVIAAAETKKPVNIKCGQFSAPAEMKNAVKKVLSVGNEKIILTYRGFTFGYNNLVADMRAFSILRENNFPVVFDATHSVQFPGGQGTKAGGDGKMAPYLARAAVAAGVDGIFAETHDTPEKALSDGANMIPLGELKALLGELIEIDEIIKR